jgi:hypothetical protein
MAGYEDPLEPWAQRPAAVPQQQGRLGRAAQFAKNAAHHVGTAAKVGGALVKAVAPDFRKDDSEDGGSDSTSENTGSPYTYKANGMMMNMAAGLASPLRPMGNRLATRFADLNQNTVEGRQLSGWEHINNIGAAMNNSMLKPQTHWAKTYMGGGQQFSGLFSKGTFTHNVVPNVQSKGFAWKERHKEEGSNSSAPGASDTENSEEGSGLAEPDATGSHPNSATQTG